MKVQFFRGEQNNFGDELNLWLWPKLLPDFFDDDTSILFIGIGSILGKIFEDTAKKIVFGAGHVADYNDIPTVNGGDWDIFFVRGRRTARALGLDETLGIGDAATLIRALDIQFERKPSYVGFMPHWESMRRGDWCKVCKLAGIRLIDPTKPVDQVITEILGCELLVTEAMHGAIVADALRVPWIPVLPIDHNHREKWFDWADTLNLNLVRHHLSPSSSAELRVATKNRPIMSRLARVLTWPPIVSFTKPVIRHASAPFMRRVAAKSLAKIATESPSLSSDDAIENVLRKMKSKVRDLESRYNKSARLSRPRPMTSGGIL